MNKFINSIYVLSVLSIYSVGHTSIIPKAKNLLENFRCSKEAKELLSSWQSTQQWEAIASTPTSPEYTTPTKKMSVWIQMKKNKNDLLISKVTPFNYIDVKISGNCKKSIKQGKFKISKKKYSLDDTKLASFIHKNKQGIIYSWSPQMELSIRGLKEILELSKEKKIPLLVVADPEVTQKQIKEALKRFSINLDKVLVNRSFELKMRKSFIHYPSTLAFKDGAIISPIYPGYASKKRYENFYSKYIDIKK